MAGHIDAKRQSARRAFGAFSISVMILVFLVQGAIPAIAQEQAPPSTNQASSPELTQEPVPAAIPESTREQPLESSNQGAIPMDQLTLRNPQPGQTIFPPAEQKKFPFFTDSKFSAQLRSFYFYRDKFDDSLSEAWAIGGSFAYKSGYLANVFAIGAVVYTSQPLYAPDDRDGTLLLRSGQDGYTVLGQAYGEIKFTDRIFGAIGAKEYNTPYVNKNDTRMTPNTFEGATIYGTAGGKEGGKDGVPAWRFGAGYLSKIKDRNSTDFVWMSEDVGSDAERGVFLGGANVDCKRWSFGAIDYYCADVINIFYAEGKYTLLSGEGYDLKLLAQVSDQRSTGDERIPGGDFSTDQFGVKSDLTLGDALLTVAYTNTTGSDDMRSPWGGYPGYTSVQVQDFFRAGEQAIMLRAAYDFTNLGLKGLSAYGLWVHGFEVDSPNDNQDEFDVNLQWTPKGGPLRGMSYRLRYAYVLEDSDGDPDIQDLRFIVNFDFPRP